VGALEVDFAGGNVPTGVKAIPTMHHSQTMIDGLGSGLRILLKLMPDIIDERGLGDLGERLALRFEPAGEVEQVIGVGTERTQGELPEALAIAERIRPGQFAPVLIAQAIRRGAGGTGGWLAHRDLISGV